ncbi:phosphotransferase [Streptomyces sp. NPDC005953]|uniref:phosphotransferase family protein n=1 Tax=unclassified Streptomyces TaxID=2593676 RepID=UPI0033C5E82E
MMERVRWDELPSDLRAAITARAGQVTSAHVVPEGLHCTAALKLRTERESLFLKGVRLTDGPGLAGLKFEQEINGILAGVCPPINFQVEAAGWYCLAFAYIDGRHADFTPGTEDLPSITLTLRRMGTLRNPRTPVESLAGKFKGFLSPAEAELLTGSCLLHMDSNPHNVLVTPRRAHFVDWARAALGPAWVDPVYMATWLMTYGCPPEDALKWLSNFTSWRQADPRAVEAFVAASCRQWTDQVGEADAKERNERFTRLLGFPHEWSLGSGSLQGVPLASHRIDRS